MLKYIVFALVIALGVFAIVVARQPDEFRVTRSMKMPVYAMQIFPQVNTLKAWEAWSPWKEMDPKSTAAYAGPAEGVGASMQWEGEKTGKGAMTITQSRSNEYIEFRLDFVKPMTATNTAEFTFKQEGAETLVTWTMYGKNNFIGKAFGLVMNCDKMVGDQFERGLTRLSAAVASKNGKE